METQAPKVVRRRFSVDDYHRMAESGILHEDDRVELIDGEIFEMSPIGGRHVHCVGRLTRTLSRFVGDRHLVNVQSPVRLDERHEPQPDLAVVVDRAYGRSLPGPEDVLLLMEVSETTLKYDREVKLPLYARSGIAEAWIADLTNETIERHTEPTGSGYRHVERARREESITLGTMPGLAVIANDVLG